MNDIVVGDIEEQLEQDIEYMSNTRRTRRLMEIQIQRKLLTIVPE